jgi:hypothetical protein
MKCPVCRSEHIRRSRRRGLLEFVLMAVVFFRPFLCLRCNHRFFRWSMRSNPRASPPLDSRRPEPAPLMRVARVATHIPLP